MGKMNSTIHTLRYRASNSADGTCKRIACLMMLVIATTVAITLIVLDRNEAINLSKLRGNRYGTKKWDNLPVDVQHAAIKLDYDKHMWDNSEPFERFDRPWYELSNEQKAAAETLGYSQSDWCLYNSDYDTEMEKRREYYPQYHWEALPDKAREALLMFGFDKKGWNSGNNKMRFEMDWEDMAPNKQAAAKELGYDEDIWCSEELSDDWGNGGMTANQPTTSTHPKQTSTHNQQTVHQSINGPPLAPTAKPVATTAPPTKAPATIAPIRAFKLHWENLTPEQVDAAKSLGYNHIKWERHKKIRVFANRWENLPSDQKNAAKILGYDKTTWNVTKQVYDNEQAELAATDHPTEVFYFDVNWHRLPEDVRDAAKFLGFDSGFWNDHKVPYDFSLSWEELSQDQKEAIETLGYTKETWATKEEMYEEAMDARREFYPDYQWNDLPQDVKDAAKVLGLDETKWGNSVAVVYKEEWVNLTTEEQEAAKTLGYDDQTWTEYNEQFKTEESTHWLQVDWEELPMNVRDAADVFGFDRDSWDNYERIPQFNKDWNDLSQQRKDAAKVLGYDEATWQFRWDHWKIKDDTMWIEKAWKDLPEDKQSAAKVFGFNEDSWDRGIEPVSYQKDWEELSTLQMEAAKALGYDKDLWCEAELSAKYDHMMWTELPADVQGAAVVMGFDQAKWDGNSRPDSYEKAWKDLSALELAAVDVLGYDEAMWCEDWVDP